ncbi:hypothetical protein C7293_08775 [filamentous cyanobacterium CCT1]|nr:hypothetical protein C7293_08775 [filamentous cyanobacterium CCT1]PSN79725.1 hypothetical protein C8B47_10200 [filamentous cyanobacterium CCP4]
MTANCVSDKTSQSNVQPVQSKSSQTSTAAELWQSIQTVLSLRKSAPPLVAVPRDRAIAASFTQERLFWLNQLAPENAAYNIPFAFRIEGELDLSALQRSLCALIERHESLRTTFQVRDGVPVLVSQPPVIPLSTIDLHQSSQPPKQAFIEQLLSEEARSPFDLEAGPLFRAKLFQLADREYILTLTVHHIVFDGWSEGILLQDLAAFYDASCAGKDPDLSDLPVQYADFASWQRQWLQGDVLDTLQTYWKGQLEGALQDVSLPLDRPRKSGWQACQSAYKPFVLSQELTTALKALSRSERSTLFTTLLAAFHTVLYHYSGQENQFVCTPTANRNRNELNSIVGYFVNLLVLRSDLSGNPTFQELLGRLKHVVSGANAYQDLPVQQLTPCLGEAQVSLSRILFALQNTPQQSLQLSNLAVTRLDSDNGTADFDIFLSLAEEAGTIKGVFKYNADILDEATIQQWVLHYQRVLEAIVLNPAVAIADALVLTEKEQNLIRQKCLNSVTKASAPKAPETSSDGTPQSETEIKLAQIWQNVLGRPSISIHDNFFDLGGHSLLVLVLFSSIEEQFGQKFPVSTLLQAPTIAQLAAMIDGTQPDLSSSVVLLKAGTKKTPLFLIHDGDGEILLYRNLANHLSERTVYGVQPHSRANYPVLHTRLEDMASYYVEQIQSVQPQGPYLLGGLCAGGILAFEVARQLQSQRQPVAMVAIFDAADVKAAKRVGRIAKERLNSFSKTLAEAEQLKAYQRALFMLNKGRQKVANLIAYEVSSRVQTIHNQLKLQAFRYYLDKQLPLPHFLQHISVRQAFDFAKLEYEPETSYDGELLLFRATRKVVDSATSGIDDEPFVNIYSDPELGWGVRTTASVQVYDVPGGHSSMLQEPNVAIMAEQMQHYIESVLEQENPSYALAA